MTSDARHFTGDAYARLALSLLRFGIGLREHARAMSIMVEEMIAP